ncbi:MAG: 4Fe-4S dicluster domain-containing protein, partial [Bacteroidota bacterium]
SLHDGIIKFPESASTAGNFSQNALLNIKKEEAKGYTFVINKNYFIGDGKFANNGWLMEIPHPVSKITWDNYASLAPATAKELNVKFCDLIEVDVNGSKLTLPVVVQPGMAEKVICIEAGYGRTNAGTVADNVGVNINNVKNRNNAGWYFSGANVRKIRGNYPLASTQEHHLLDEPMIKDLHYKRGIVKDTTIDEYKKYPEFNKSEKHHLITIMKEVPYTGVKWAMVIDMNKCTGCSQCVASCNVENNVPVVGKDQVLKGREMHWVRIDRYYSGTNEEPVSSVQPVICTHCDNAPCENVCPVAATNHSPDGLNQMAYNRCVGTRYCANNCPFKVRRYNFFNFRDHFGNGYYQQDSLQLLHNPEVTVRSRGVMEKCTFCVQRIMEARQEATKEGRTVKGEDVRTACQCSCPSNAIVFGDMNDPNSEISKLLKHNLNYTMLEELNIKPNISYIAKLRNTNSEEV